MTTVVLRDVAQIDLNAGAKGIFLLSLDYGDMQGQTRTLTVQGLSQGVAGITVSSSSARGVVSGVATVAATGHFTASLTVPVAGAFGYVVVEATEAVSGAAPAFDRCAAQLGDLGTTSLPQPGLANFDSARLDYLAGFPDRFIPSRTYVQLNFPIRLKAHAAAMYYPTGAGKLSTLRSSSLDQIDGKLRTLLTSVNAGKLTIAQYYASAEREMKELALRESQFQT
ncbi:hypothetical protein [Shinella sp.]|uniref:hypothetical protein n=1 Tax=Shinella sp. TaxID=1870904 RepID=UPI00258595CC|nr:hypothetical protein [Shinella sp.]MCW5710713.1 hypothetical protein [Shinella sp.]